MRHGDEVAGGVDHETAIGESGRVLYGSAFKYLEDLKINLLYNEDFNDTY